MPTLLTERYKNTAFVIPYSVDKSEYVRVRPMTESLRNQINVEALLEAGGDHDAAATVRVVKFLQKSIVDWQGFKDVAGNDIPCTPENIKMLCEVDGEFMGQLVFRITNVARTAELEDEKN